MATLTSRARAEPAPDIARAQEDFLREHGDRPIATLRVEGLRRTRPAVVAQWIDCRAGEPLARCNLSRIRERLYRLAIFSEVDVSITDASDGAEVIVRLEEKWTLYPVPMLWYSPGTQIAGLVLVEANLLGFNKGLALGGVYSNRGWYLLGGYNDPNIALTRLWGSLHAFYGSGEVENQSPDGRVLQSYEMRRFDFEHALGWTFFDELSLAWTGAARFARVGDSRVAGPEPAKDASVTVQGILVVYADRRYRDLYDEGVRLAAEAQHALPLEPESPSYDAAILDAKWAGPLPLRGFFDARAHAFLGSVPVAFEERLGGLDGSRTLPGSGLVAADRYASLSLMLQVPVLDLRLGTATAGVFGELGRYDRNEEPPVTYGGPGAGVRFFLKRVAVPVIGLDAGYEVGSERVRFSVSVGYRPVR